MKSNLYIKKTIYYPIPMTSRRDAERKHHKLCWIRPKAGTQWSTTSVSPNLFFLCDPVVLLSQSHGGTFFPVTQRDLFRGRMHGDLHRRPPHGFHHYFKNLLVTGCLGEENPQAKRGDKCACAHGPMPF